MKNKNNKGFTLVELIIVVAIIAILAAVLAPQYIRYVERSRQSNDLQVAANIMKAATIAIADPQNGVPIDAEVYIVWETDEFQPDIKGQLSLDTDAVNLPNPGNRDYEVALIDAIGAGVGGEPMVGFDPDEDITWTDNRYHWNIDLPMSVAAGDKDFKFSIDVSTGEFTFYFDQEPIDTEAELAEYKWITEIGVNP